MFVPDPLEPILRTVEPAVRLVSERHLRKVLLYLHDHGQPLPLNPALPFWIARSDLVAADVLPVEVLGPDHRLLLLTTPRDRKLDTLDEGGRLRAYWRLLFQAEVMAAIDHALVAGTLTPEDCSARLDRFGFSAAREVRYVLEADRFVDPAAGPAEWYRMFAAVYLDLHYFAPFELAEFFPSLPPAAVVVAAFNDVAHFDTVLARSRPRGAVEAEPEPFPDALLDLPSVSLSGLTLACPAGYERGGLLARAAEAEKKGNFARAAILATQAVDAGDHRGRAVAAAALGRLVRGLAGVLGWKAAVEPAWRGALASLLAPASGGFWPRAARCLYELQKIPAELTGEVYAADLVECIRTLGRRPVKRPLPYAREPMILRRLRVAHNQLMRSNVGERVRATLLWLLDDQIHKLEATVREKLGPIVMAAITESGFHPQNQVEEVAREKVVAELLDRVCERGYLRVGDLRDAIARNQLKMPDLAGPLELVGGDPLLRADTRLAYDLDGVYRRGEFYLRILQRATAVAFGTPVGRWVSLYLIAPFLTAFLILMAMEELRHIGGKIYSFSSTLLAPAAKPAPPPPIETVAEPEFGWDPVTKELVWFEKAEQVAKQVVTSSAAGPESGQHHASMLIAWPTILGLGLFLLLVFHVRRFRQAVLSIALAVWAVVRRVVWDIPRAILRSPTLVALRYSAPARFVGRHLRGAILFTVIIVGMLWFLGASSFYLLEWGGIEFVVAAILLNTPWGWTIQERLFAKIADGWRLIRVNLLPGIVTVLVDRFRRLANWVEQRLYAVDEWLRYRSDDSRGSFLVKAGLGLIWFPIAYVARFTFYLLIEPQINPVKHFPVVTVSHKVILPMTPSLASALSISDATAAGLLACVPGVFGFIAWELGANWRLYRATRPAWLRPVVIGSHGETMRGLLRPGFHSGTIPRMYRRLRAAARRGDRPAAARYHHEIEHTYEAVNRFIERELIARLERAPEWGQIHVCVKTVRFGCQRAVIEFAAGIGGGMVLLAFENRAGQIEATIEDPGWIDKLTSTRRSVFLDALRGLLDMAAADLFGDCERSAEPADGRPPPTVCSELARPYSWTEWVSRWE